MHLKLTRTTLTPKSTIGGFYVDGTWFGYSLEDVVRPKGQKVANKTAIPAGTYKVIWNKSTRFSAKAGHDVFMPLLLDVPGFAGVRIHSGSRPEDTEGCLLIGFHRYPDFINGSRDAIAKLYPLIEHACAHEGCTIQIS